MEVTESPCIHVCSIDPASRLCIGCGRSIDEISRWVAMSPAARRAIMDILPARLEELDIPVPVARERTGRRRLRERG